MDKEEKENRFIKYKFTREAWIGTAQLRHGMHREGTGKLQGMPSL